MKYKIIDFDQIKVLILSARRRRTWLAVFLRTFCYRSCTLLMCWTASRAGNGYLLLELMMTMMMLMMIMLMMIRALQNCFILPPLMGECGVSWENTENLDNTKRWKISTRWPETIYLWLKIFYLWIRWLKTLYTLLHFSVLVEEILTYTLEEHDPKSAQTGRTSSEM